MPVVRVHHLLQRVELIPVPLEPLPVVLFPVVDLALFERRRRLRDFKAAPAVVAEHPGIHVDLLTIAQPAPDPPGCQRFLTGSKRGEMTNDESLMTKTNYIVIRVLPFAP